MTWLAWRNPAAAGQPWTRWHRLAAGGRTACGTVLPPAGWEQTLRDVEPLIECRRCKRAAGGLARPHRRRPRDARSASGRPPAQDTHHPRPEPQTPREGPQTLHLSR